MEVAAHEALLRQTYYDSVGVPTWDVGMTNATGHNVERYWGKPQPLQHCMNLFVWALDRYADQVREVFAGRDLTEAQFAAALSFHWNTGAIKRATWAKKWLAGDVAGARQSFMAWNKPPEIISRREKERDLFFDGVWTNDGTMLEFTRVTSRKTPDWGSGKKISVRQELENAFAEQAAPPLDHAPVEDVEEQGPTLSSDAVPKPKPVYESTTNWAAFGSFLTAVIGALQSLDPYIAVPLILVAGGLTAWIIRERLLKSREIGV